jgi:hypothetical protein
LKLGWKTSHHLINDLMPTLVGRTSDHLSGNEKFPVNSKNFSFAIFQKSKANKINAIEGFVSINYSSPKIRISQNKHRKYYYILCIRDS